MNRKPACEVTDRCQWAPYVEVRAASEPVKCPPRRTCRRHLSTIVDDYGNASDVLTVTIL